jgi:ribonuclease HII
MQCGIDEAGRGPVIGPLVVAGACVTKEQELKLQQLGVTDSKALSEKKRKELEPQIKEIVSSFEVVIITPEEIDARVQKQLSLNSVEAIASADIIKKLKPKSAVIDCCSTNQRAYKQELQKRSGFEKEMIVEFKADESYMSVGAASILAKVKRDQIIEELKEELGVDFGSGYPSDPKTKEFVKKYWDKYDVFRKSWESFKNVQKENEQKGLGDF